MEIERKSKWGLVTMLIINPCLILLFQNCSFHHTPNAGFESKFAGGSKSNSLVQRGLASVAPPETKQKPAKSPGNDCKYLKRSCAE